MATAFSGRLYADALALLIHARDTIALSVRRPGPGDLACVPVQMRMTAHLIDAMAWIMMQCAASRGEIGLEEALSAPSRLNPALETDADDPAGFESMRGMESAQIDLALAAAALWRRCRRLEAGLVADLDQRPGRGSDPRR